MIRALITRPRDEAESLAAELARRDIKAVIEPMIEIVGRDPVLPDLSGVQAILCTSANGARALARATGQRHLPVFAVGDATGRAARAAGFSEVLAAGGVVGDLARLVSKNLRPSNGKLLHVAGSDVAGDLVGMLSTDGFAVERAVLYEAVAATALSQVTARLIAAGEIDLTLFFSPRSAAIFARLVAAARVGGGLSATVAVSISAAADAALGALSFHERAVAAAPTQAALLDLVVRFAGQPARIAS